jgi:hypothetical protein
MSKVTVQKQPISNDPTKLEALSSIVVYEKSRELPNVNLKFFMT